jgi:protein-tyrosine phosphatase/arsenate reductase
MEKKLFESIQKHCESLTKKFDEIPEDRQQLLHKLSEYIQEKHKNNSPIQLVFICTHNSRRSHFGQVWAAVAAAYYGIENVHSYSGGTESTAFNPNAIQALKNTGFEVKTEETASNPHYTLHFGEELKTSCFSKTFDDPANPSSNFAAVMTCSHAEENCPFVPGTELRIGITYDDPKDFDGTPQQDEKYMERSNQIALEILYTLSLVNN